MLYIEKVILDPRKIKPRHNLHTGSLAEVVRKEKILKEYEGATPGERWGRKMA